MSLRCREAVGSTTDPDSRRSTSGERRTEAADDSAATRDRMVDVAGAATVVSACATRDGERAAPRRRARDHAVATAAAGRAQRDTDRDGLSDGDEVRRYHTDPRKRDTDRDGLSDGDEVRRYHTNPRRPDTDHDGLTDSAEVGRYRTDPRKRDTDRDGLTTATRSAATTRTRANGTPMATSTATEPRFARAQTPATPAAVPVSPREDNTGVPRRDGVVGVHGPVEDHDAEHGDRREDDRLHRGVGARSRDPQLEDLVRRLLRGRESTRAPTPARRC